MLDRLINIGLGLIISSLLGVIAYNLFWPQAEMDVSQPSPAEKIQEYISKIDDALSMNQTSQAESSVNDAMKIAVSIAGDEGPEVGKVLAKRGEVRARQGEKKDAEADYKHAIAIFEKTNGMEYESAKTVYVKLSDLCFKREAYDQSEEYLRRGLQAAEKASDESAQARFWRAIALVKEKQGKDDEAEECNDKAARLTSSQR